ncbi:phospholipase D-like protein [Streptohalobacillus salinus]|uniref:Phospholipase D-like protein n=1 Tax=Streptohalobacillus salinus TaxID=621096 RepID=A0A2V3W3W8_9BACI|nr:PLDc N-terminal domain-containing protein [Streptohalobacillus salinus]PXW88987.1 phospholipase D-like protein [Streptohalobacillus salinus]
MAAAELGNLLRLIAPLLALQFILMIVGIFAWYKADENNTIKGNKWAWLFVIILINTIGPILFFILGRRQD